ncbi:MAG: hypothetical protein ACI8RE_002392 [Ilumatobacter sp.]|jgi:hypothetical protein
MGLIVIQSPQPVRSLAVSIGSSQVAVQSILAHEGGWDEILLVAGPIVVIIALLLLAKRRVDAIAPNDARRPSESTTSSKASKSTK